MIRGKLKLRNSKGVALKAKWRWMIFIGALLLTAPAPVWAFTLFGDPNVLSPGQVWSLPFTLFGEQVTPRLDVDGFVRTQILAEQLKAPEYGFDHYFRSLLVPEVDLEVNLQLTATQRIHMQFLPLDGGFARPTQYEIYPGGGWTVRTVRDGGEPAEVWYEGEIFNWLAPKDQYPLDLNLAIGRFPLSFQNGILMNNIADGFAISKDNIQLFNWSNLNIIYFLTWGETQGGFTAEQQQQERKNLTGIDSDADIGNYFVEGDFLASYDNPRTIQYPANLNRFFWALSVTRSIGEEGFTLRAIGSTGNQSQGNGQFFSLETTHEFMDTRPYFNIFGATKNFLTASQQFDAPLINEGILLTPDRLTPTPGLDGSANDEIGGILGVILNPRGHTTFTPELGYTFDNTSNGNNQFGAAFQVQSDLAEYIVPGNTLQAIAARGLLYGTLARLTLAGIYNQNSTVAGESFDYISKLELIYEF
ncbi:MAG TPA: hypothetical protein VMF10_16300 [Candidatus Aquilonibacter sp.]|nr:hypothetical protein [Candidatus Aquilonibacter sp.]